jgi:hypothetical protein
MPTHGNAVRQGLNAPEDGFAFSKDPNLQPGHPCAGQQICGQMVCKWPG